MFLDQQNRAKKNHRGSRSNQIFSHTRAGTSLIIALGLITLIVLIAVGIGTIVVGSIRDSANVTRANEAFYAAEGALEQGLLVNSQAGAGYNTPGPQNVDYIPIACPQGQSAGNVNQECNLLTANYQIQGQVPPEKKYSDGFGIPTPGTGTAGTGCDPLNPIVSGNFYYPPNNQSPNNVFPAEDHPCNWNKIKAGETVNIPLYTTTTDPNANCPVDPDNPDYKVCNPENLGLTSLIVKVRTPCTNGESMCQPIDRYQLDTAHGDPNVNYNDTIIDWQITGKSIDEQNQYVLNPYRLYDHSFCKDESFLQGRCYPQNSEIYESQINYKKDKGNVVLSESKKGQEVSDLQLGTLLQFLLNQTPWNIGGSFRPSTSQKITKPVLRLSIIHDLQENNTTPIPYLEYQVLVNVNNANLLNLSPSNANQDIVAEGYSGGFKQVLEVKKPQKGGAFEYVIEQ